MSDIGFKYQLVKCSHSNKAYQDQAEIWHPGDIVEDQIVVEVINATSYDRGYGPQSGKRLYAKDSKDNIYTCNINTIDYWGGADYWSCGHESWRQYKKLLGNFVNPDGTKFKFTAVWEKDEPTKISWKAADYV